MTCRMTHLKLDPQSPDPPYIQLQEALKAIILEKRLARGARLPGVRKLAETCGASHSTVHRALAGLAREGLVAGRSGSGTYVTGLMDPATEIIFPHRSGEGLPEEAFMDVIISSTREVFGEAGRRTLVTYMDGDHTSAREITEVCHARRADSLLVYRPRGHIARELARVDRDIAMATLIHPLAATPADCVLCDPSESLQGMLRRRLDAGCEDFALASWLPYDSAAPYLATDPKSLLYDAFMQTMAEAGIEPVVARWRLPRTPGAADLRAFAASLRAGTVVFGLPPVVEGLAEHSLGPLDMITYTEWNWTLAKHRERGDSVIYAGIEICTRRAVELLCDRVSGERDAQARHVFVKPAVFDSFGRKGGDRTTSSVQRFSGSVGS